MTVLSWQEEIIQRVLADVAQWNERWPANQKVIGSIPIRFVRARAWVANQVLSWGHARCN